MSRSSPMSALVRYQLRVEETCPGVACIWSQGKMAMARTGFICVQQGYQLVKMEKRSSVASLFRTARFHCGGVPPCWVPLPVPRATLSTNMKKNNITGL